MKCRAGAPSAGMLGQQAGRAQHQIVVAPSREARRLGPGHLERQRRRRPSRHPVADIGKADEAVEQMIAVRPPPGQHAR